MKSGRAAFERKAIPSFGIVFETGWRSPSRQRIEAIGPIDAIGAPEDQWNPPHPSVFQDMERPKAVIINIEKRIRIAADNGRLGTRVANQLDVTGKVVEIFTIANIAMKKRNTVSFKHVNVVFAAPAHEIVHNRDLVPFCSQVKCNM